ncbi:MAG TPA: helix-turn-helix transcriptional regulator [Verrucomicrobiae bacterium]|nr:helix-turn-helix transcriptional regulator [Verrucomicrobiae bacterium]
MNDLLLLASLLDGPKHGYALKKRIGLLLGQAALHNNIVYPLLKRFVEAGWVSRRATSGERGQTREVYSLTKTGKRILLERVSELSEKDAASPDALRLRVGMFSVLQSEKRVAILQRRGTFLAKRMERLDAVVEHLPLDPWSKEVVSFLRSQVEMERNWLKRLEKLAKKATDSATDK